MKIWTIALVGIASGALGTAATTGCGGDPLVFGGEGGGGGEGGAASAECGDGVVQGTEECDDGNDVQDDGCDNACKYNCVAGDASRDRCDDGNACNGEESCGADHACVRGTALQDGDSCGADLICVNGGCVSASCGDALLQDGEECDDGNSANGDGCESDCKLSCLSTDPTRDCSTLGGDECGGPQSCDDVSHTCVGAPLDDGTSCNGGAGSCLAGACVPAGCGNGVVEPGEGCEPPGTATCSSTCQPIGAAICGDGTIDPGEDCDDGNTANLDGCDQSCKYETLMRMDSMKIKLGTAPSFCSVTTNQLGKAITSTAEGTLNGSLQDGIDAGTMNVLIQALGLDDPKGVADPSLEIGVTSGYLDPAHPGTWPTSGNPMDWWYLLDKNTLDASGLPDGRLTPASITARALVGGPSDVNLRLLLAGSAATLQMLDAKVSAQFGTKTSKPAAPPTSFASGFASVEEIDATGSAAGLCGNVTVDSLAKIPIPESLTTGAGKCGACGSSSYTYTYCGEGQPVGPSCNSLLDVLVGGCKVLACIATAISPTQPDVSGSGTKALTVSGPYHKVSQATVGNTNAYSSWLSFHGKRAHATGQK